MGDAADLVVELFEDQGVAGGVEVGGAEEVGGVGVGEGDVPAGHRLVFQVFVFLGVVGRDGLGDEPVDDHGAAGGPVGELFVDPHRCGHGQAVGLVGDAAGLPGRHLQAADSFPQQWEPVAQVEGVGDQLRPSGGGHAHCQRERFGGERRHGGGAVPAERLVGQERRPTGRLDTGVGRGGVEVGPVRGELELAERGASLGLFGFGGGFEHAGGVEVADLVLLPDRRAHGTKSSIDHRHSRASESPVSTRGVDRDHRDPAYGRSASALRVRRGARPPQPAEGGGARCPWVP